MKKVWIVLAVALAVVSLPALYAASFVYGQVKDSTEVFRVNRFTGRKELATDYGWLTQKELGERMTAEYEATKATFRNVLNRVDKEAQANNVDYATWNGSNLTVALRTREVIHAEAPEGVSGSYGSDVVGERLRSAGVQLRNPDPLAPN